MKVWNMYEGSGLFELLIRGNNKQGRISGTRKPLRRVILFTDKENDFCFENRFIFHSTLNISLIG